MKTVIPQKINKSQGLLFKFERMPKLNIDIPNEEAKRIEQNDADLLERTPKSFRKELGERGFYDTRNSLNDLTGKEWKFMSKSVITRSYPPDFQHNLRKQHGGQKPPLLCADLIKTFTKKGEMVLDPFMGVGGTLIGASLCGRKGIGIELNKKWIEIYKQVCELEDLEELKTFNDDCKNVIKKMNKNSIDFILTDVPYWNMDKVEKTRSKAAAQSNLSRFNGKEIQTKQEWLDELTEVFEICYEVLKNKKYLAVFIGDMYRGKEYHILSADLANAIKSKTKFLLKANLIWYDVSKNLHVYGQPFAFIPSMIHQNILIFRKEE
jgi:DNA modification methylase